MSEQLMGTTAVAERDFAVKPPGSRLRGHPWWTLVSVALGVFMVGLDGSVVSIANPRIAEDLHASLSDLQWITNAYLLALAALLILAGKLGDRFGRRLVFLIGVVGFGATSVAIGLVGNTTGVIAFRVLQGVFGALLMPNTLAILRSAFPAEKLNAAIGIWGGASAVSIALGPMVGGLLVEHVSWQSVFYVNAPVAIIALVVGSLAIKESRSEGADQTLDLPGTISLSGGLFLVIFGLIKAQEWGWSSGKTIGFLLSGLGVLVLFVGIELRTRAPLLPMRLFRSRSLSLGTVVVLINTFAMFGVLFFMTLYLQNVQGNSPIGAGVRILPLSLAVMVSAPLGGIVTEKLGPRVPMVTGLAAVALSLGMMTTLHATSAYGALVPSFILMGLGLGLVMTASSDAVIGNASLDDAGIAGGLQSTAIQLGGVVGTAVLGSILTSKVGSVLMAKLVHAGTPSDVASRMTAYKEYVAQGVAPALPSTPSSVQAAITAGSHDAFMTGLHASMWVGASAALLGAVLALFVQRGENSGTAGPAIH